MRNLIRALAVGAAVAMAFAPAGAATVNVTNPISTSTTWTANNVYILTEVVYVTNGATLTIEPGTVVRGEPESTPGAEDPGTLVVTRGCKLVALGTASAPITFTNLDDDNVPGMSADPNGTYASIDTAIGITETWGGVILLGRGYVANNTLSGPDPNRTFQVEGLNPDPNSPQNGLYGGSGLDDDDSGVLNYVSIRYGGFNLDPNNEINGLTLGAVGRSTDIDHVEVFNNKDDGLEMFGGTVNLKHIAIVNPGDDGMDYDEGWRGKAQFVLLVQGTPGPDKSDKGGEHDGGNAPDGSQPFAVPTFYNVTYIGHGQKSFTSDVTNTGIHFRDNAGGRYYNSFFGDFGGAPFVIEGGSTNPTGPLTSGERSITAYSVLDPNFHPGPASSFQLELQDNTFWCFDPNVPAGGVPTGALAITFGGDTGKAHHDNGAFTDPNLDNELLPCVDPLPIRALVKTPVGISTVPDITTFIDPRMDPNGPLAVTNRTAPNDGFFTPVSYRGAFDGSNNWLGEWSNMDRLGYFPDLTSGVQVPVTNPINTSQTWTANNEYILTDVVYLTNGATLTIEPGTVVRGEPESTPGAEDPGTLVVTRGSRIVARGTKDAPIVFTNLQDDNVRGEAPDPNGPYASIGTALGITETWGGVIVLGRSYVANNTLGAPNSSRTFQIEGLNPDPNSPQNGLYGGSGLDDDDSGVLNYVSIRYGGFNLDPNNEINGLTLGAVGRSTDIDHVEVFNNKDDGLEMFGGTVNLKHVAIINAGDDGLDYDEGWRGKVQFAYIQQGTPGPDKSDKGGEHDGGNAPDGSQPFAVPTIYNATFIGHGQKSFTSDVTNTGLHFRDNAGGRYYNSFFGDFGGAPFVIEGGSTNPTGPLTSGERSITAYSVLDPNFHPEPSSDFQLEVQDSTFWCFDPNVPAGGLPTGALAITFGGDTGKAHHDNGAFTNISLDNELLGCATPLPIRTLSRTVLGGTLPDPITEVDPRLDPSGPLAVTDRMPPSDGFFEPAPYRGAFRSGENWMQGWSNTADLKYFATCDGGINPEAIPEEAGIVTMGGPFLDDTTRISWEPPSGAAGDEVYDVLRSTDPSNFNSATCVATDTTDLGISDMTLPSIGETFFYLVRTGNSCGDATMGTDGSGFDRVGGSCP